MRKGMFLLFLLMVMSSHDMFLKMDGYFLKSGEAATIKLFNGTFDRSDNVISRDRMIDVSLVGGGKRTSVDTSQWIEKDSMTLLNFTSGKEGTWVAGVSIRPKKLTMKAEDFNEYLEHDGITDMLEWRKNNNVFAQDATEEYSKHVKTIFQVGKKITDDYKTILGYPIEFVPLENPYNLHPGHDLEVQLLFQGKPLSNQLVYTGFQAGIHTHTHTHSHEDGHTHAHAHSPNDTIRHSHDQSSGLRTDERGIVKLALKEEGIFYMRTIHLVNTDRDSLTHISNWATLTFEVGHGHEHDHSHEKGHNHGIPMYVYILGSLALIGILFFWFNTKK